MRIWRQCSDDANGTNEVAWWRTESKIRRWGPDGLLAAVEPPVGIRLCVGERNGQQVVGNLRVGEVLQVSSLVGSHNATEVEPIGDFETDVFAFVHRECAESPNEN
jgi:hypothetical protein